MSYLQMALKAVKQERQSGEDPKIKLVKAMTEVRRQSLEDVMTAILLDARNRIIETHQVRQYQAVERMKQMEQNIDRLWNEVMSGSAKLEDFRTACGNWISTSAEAIHE